MAGENEDTSDNFDDLAPLGRDGTGKEQDNGQDSVEDRGSRLDKMLDDHLAESDRDSSQDSGATAKATTTQQGTTQGQGRQPQRQGEGTNQDDRAQQRGQGDGRATQDGQDTRPPRSVGSFFRATGDGSIYDLQGRKVANAGLERRIFDRVTRYYNGMETEAAGLKQRLTNYEEANTVAKRENLSLEETAFGLRIVSAWKKDPIETLNFLLTQAQNQGKDISSIRSGGAAFDPAAVGSLLEEKLAAALAPLSPLLEQVQQAREIDEVREQVNNDITAFFQEHPNAVQHRPVLGALMQKLDIGDPREAWLTLREQAVIHGWDLNRPLVDQAQATVRQRNGAPTSDGNSRTVPDMTGRGGGGGNGSTVRAGALGAASKDDSWDDIVASSIGFRP